MRLRIEHVTTFSYEEAICEAYIEMRLRPLEADGQRCLSFSLMTEPKGDVMRYRDRYGNMVHHFDTLQSHEKVIVTATSEVETADEWVYVAEVLSPLDSFDYLAPTEYAPNDAGIRSFAEELQVKDGPEGSARAIMDAIYTSLKYDPDATDVNTTAPEALELKRGVCQDFAHLMLSACRGAGIPSKYVSGYLHDPKTLKKYEEAGIVLPANAASHAWVDVYIPERGWLSLDPTHNCAQTKHYVRVATGRDYADVPPTRGVYKGHAKESLNVKVSVSAL